MALSLRRDLDAGVDRLTGRFMKAWRRTDMLFDIVGLEAMLAKPIVWRHPFIFYVGHLPAFSWNQICGGLLEWRSFHPRFDELFCRGIDPDVDTGECHWHPEVPDQWPTLAETIRYRDAVRSAIVASCELLARDYFAKQLISRGGEIAELVLEHEYMHQETLLYMMAQLAPAAKRRPKPLAKYSFGPARPSRSIRIPAGTARIGARPEVLRFGWDNEFGEMEIDVPEFTIDSLPVTNGEFYSFVESGGYDGECHWQPADWC
jgi:hypothetical protein